MKEDYLKILLVSLVYLVFGISCSEPNEPVEAKKYKPGEVYVSFQDSVDHHFIRSLIDKLKLTPLYIDADSSFGMWIQVDSGLVKNHLARLQKDTAVSWANQSGYPFELDPSKQYIRAQFKGSIKIDYAITLIRSISGISWKKTLLPGRSAMIIVPIGMEYHWIQVFSNYSFVTFAGLNTLFYSST